MSLLNKPDEEIIKIAEPIWDNLIKSSNIKDYGGFTRDFSIQMLYGANEVELGKQWAGNELISNLSDKSSLMEFLYFVHSPLFLIHLPAKITSPVRARPSISENCNLSRFRIIMTAQ